MTSAFAFFCTYLDLCAYVCTVPGILPVAKPEHRNESPAKLSVEVNSRPNPTPEPISRILPLIANPCPTLIEPARVLFYIFCLAPYPRRHVTTMYAGMCLCLRLRHHSVRWFRSDRSDTDRHRQITDTDRTDTDRPDRSWAELGWGWAGLMRRVNSVASRWSKCGGGKRGMAFSGTWTTMATWNAGKVCWLYGDDAGERWMGCMDRPCMYVRCDAMRCDAMRDVGV
jgi:hypothetical protein